MLRIEMNFGNPFRMSCPEKVRTEVIFFKVGFFVCLAGAKV